MIILSILVAVLTILTLIILKIIGSTMKGCCKKIRKKEEGGSSCPMGKCFRGISMKIRYKGLGSFIPVRGRQLKEFGEIASYSKSSATNDLIPLSMTYIHIVYMMKHK